ncbi:MAG: hypothetical protein GWO08_01340 [Gammaproteobacteria bacterium]|nr:hypothetical protein [Gammaproteobacteria bacterium]NIR92351.1 hypothetical protein [Gammaproteobacteria bacterium]
MRYRANIGDDRVNHLIGQCLRSKANAEWIYDLLVSKNLRKVDLITGSVHLSPEEHAEFVARFSAEVEPTIWESSFRKQ